jgi:hypothetical protein
MTRRLLILERLAARAAVITIANGFATNAGASLYLGAAPELSDGDPDEAIAIVPRDDTPTEPTGRVDVILPVEIQAIAKASLEEPWTRVELLIGDLKRAIELEDRTLGSTLKGQMKRGPTRTLERLAGSTTVGAGVLYLCPYVEEWGNPAYGVPPEES